MKQSMIINSEVKTSDLFNSNQKFLNWLVFFSIFPIIKIAGISISFFIFLIIVFTFMNARIKLFKIETKTDVLVLSFLFFLVLASLFAEETTRERSAFSLFKLTVQYIYWGILALYIKTWIHRYNFYDVSKYIFFAILVSTFYYIVINKFYFLFRPNEFAFTLVLGIPLSFSYMTKRFSKIQIIVFSLFFILGIFWCQSRTGLALVLFELLLLVYIHSSNVRKATLFSVIFIVPLLYMSYLIVNLDKQYIKNIKYEVADLVENISPKYAYTLRLEENVFERDKSFLIRKLMIQKGEQIFEEHPFLGIGIGNFTYYSVDLDMNQASHWLSRGEKRYNKVSSQNSYLKVITETGLITSFFVFLLFLIILIYGFRFLINIKDEIRLFIFVAYLALIFYGFILVTIQGAKFWILLGLAMAIINQKKKIS